MQEHFSYVLTSFYEDLSKILTMMMREFVPPHGYTYKVKKF